MLTQQSIRILVQLEGLRGPSRAQHGLHMACDTIDTRAISGVRWQSARIIRRVIPLNLSGFPAKCYEGGEIHCETREFEVVLHTQLNLKIEKSQIAGQATACGTGKK